LAAGRRDAGGWREQLAVGAPESPGEIASLR
jgi:hypothetical protein